MRKTTLLPWILSLAVLAAVLCVHIPSAWSQYSQPYQVLQDVNYRVGPGTNYAKYGSVPRGTIVYVTGIVDGWYAVELENGGVAYIYSKYLAPAGNYAAPQPPGYGTPPAPPGYGSPGPTSVDHYGAIAYSPSTGVYGYSYNYTTQSEAEYQAHQKCGYVDCQTATWVKNGCMSLAVNDYDYWAGAWGNTYEEARGKAILSCQESGYVCRTVEVICTD